MFNDEDVVAIRTQRWIFHPFLLPWLTGFDGKRGLSAVVRPSKDISESYSVAKVHPDALAGMQERMKAARVEFGPLKAKQPPKVFRDRLQQLLKEQLSQD
jgi:hypothetical protein